MQRRTADARSPHSDQGLQKLLHSKLGQKILELPVAQPRP